MKILKSAFSLTMGVLLAGCICVALTATAQAAGLRLEKNALSYDALRVRVIKGEAGMKDLAFYYKDKLVARAENNVKPLREAARALRDFPGPGDESLLVTIWTGGAHCCFEQFLYTRSKGKATLCRIDRRHSDQELTPDAVQALTPDGRPDSSAKALRVLEIDDWSFAYYQTPSGKQDFAFAYSPIFSRLLVWDKGQWRPDRPGEHPWRYKRMLAGLGTSRPPDNGVVLSKEGEGARIETPPADPALESRVADQEAASIAIQLAYCQLMLNEAPERVLERLKAGLPESWRVSAEGVFKDARDAVHGFNPVEYFSLE